MTPPRPASRSPFALTMLTPFTKILADCKDAVTRRITQRPAEADCVAAVAPITRPQVALRATTLNIGAAAPHRAQEILRWLRRRDDDLIVLTETSAGAGTQLIATGLSANGYTIYDRNHPGERGVILATRLPVAAELHDYLDVTVPCRVAGVVLDTEPSIAVIGVYVPSRDRSQAKSDRKQAFIRSLLDSVGALPDDLRDRLVLVGDYNVIRRDHEPRLTGFFPYEYAMHDELADYGLSPAHEVLGSGQQHSWLGRTGNGYLYDYFHVGVELHGLVERCAYLHGPRTRRLSDHAAVVARLRLG